MIVAEFFDTGESRTCRGGGVRGPPRWSPSWRIRAGAGTRLWSGYERAFYGAQYAAMAPLFEHYGVQLWMPEVGRPGRLTRPSMMSRR